MKEHLSIFYLVSGLMIGFGVLINSKLYTFSNAQLNFINIGAALITLSTTFVRTLALKKIDNFFFTFSKFNFLLGLIIIFLGIGFQGFDQNSKFVLFFTNIDTNPLVLICLGITIGAIANISMTSNEVAEEENVRLKKLEAERDFLKCEVQKAADYINELKRRKTDD